VPADINEKAAALPASTVAATKFFRRIITILPVCLMVVFFAG
jgi:hypothetical protein